MPDLPCVLGIDLGTSSAKAVLVDTDGRLVAQSAAGYDVLSSRPGRAESDPEQWWTAVCATVRDVVAAADRQPAAVGLSGQMHGLVLTDASGAALRPALLWADSRADAELSAYRALDATIRIRLANPLVPGMTGPLLIWIAQHEPEVYARARWALQPKDWLRSRLTGQVAAEPSDASATLLYDVAGDCWDRDLVGALGLDVTMLAPLLPGSGVTAGTLTEHAADALGLAGGIPVASGAADTAAGALGSGLRHPADVQLTVGTGAQAIRPLLEPTSRADAGVHLYRSAEPTGWYHMGAILSAGISLNWVRETMNVTWAELYASLDQPIMFDGPIFIPHLAGERTPYLDAALRGSWTGLSLAHDRTSLLRAALEGVAFSIREALDALLGTHRPAQLRLAGGGTLAPGWRQLLADVLELPLHAVDVPAASARGAALLGAHAAGLVRYDEIFGRLAPRSELVAEPDLSRSSLHDRRSRFHEITLSLQSVRHGTRP